MFRSSNWKFLTLIAFVLFRWAFEKHKLNLLPFLDHQAAVPGELKQRFYIWPIKIKNSPRRVFWIFDPIMVPARILMSEDSSHDSRRFLNNAKHTRETLKFDYSKSNIIFFAKILGKKFTFAFSDSRKTSQTAKTTFVFRNSGEWLKLISHKQQTI